MTTLSLPPAMTPPDKAEPSDASLRQVYDRTRMSLIDRLSDWEDQRTWDEFYQTYWRLIYSVSLKAGLGRDEAMDAVQETVLTIAKQWKSGQKYDPAKGSFKTWLMNITRWRIADQFRKKQRNPAAANSPEAPAAPTANPATPPPSTAFPTRTPTNWSASGTWSGRAT
jgi:DNA-directed RNA polymerase specialized sigma24 family protein